jgi:hypothetical protein
VNKPARYVADMQLQQRVVMRRVGQRETALLAVLEQNIDVLPGEELQALVGRQSQMHVDHIRCQTLHFLDARRQGFDRNIGRSADLLAFQLEIRLRLGAAKEREAFSLFSIA